MFIKMLLMIHWWGYALAAGCGEVIVILCGVIILLLMLLYVV